MVVKVDYNSLSEEIQKQLQTFGTALNREINEGLKEVAEQTAATLRQGGPYNERSGKYTRDWDVKLRNRSYSSVTMTEEYTVYNKKNYQLTHLLEKGHVSRNGSRVRPFEHIKPAEELAEQMAISEVNKAVRRAAGEA
ncbi:MAG: hypothetical protein HDQ97_08985 [Lachnospiraceae bacterium]|nr:hypothetical protein [Lachnospiraceae bacterium]